MKFRVGQPLMCIRSNWFVGETLACLPWHGPVSQIHRGQLCVAIMRVMPISKFRLSMATQRRREASAGGRVSREWDRLHRLYESAVK